LVSGSQDRLDRYFRQSYYHPRAVVAVIFVIILSLSFSGCSLIDRGSDFISGKLSGRDESDAAVKAVDEFFSLVMEKDYEGAYGYLSSGDRSEKSLEDFKDEFRDVTDIVKVEANWVEVKNNIATVGIDIIDSYDGEEKIYKDVEVSLIKEEDGSWKIVYWN